MSRSSSVSHGKGTFVPPSAMNDPSTPTVQSPTTHTSLAARGQAFTFTTALATVHGQYAAVVNDCAVLRNQLSLAHQQSAHHEFVNQHMSTANGHLQAEVVELKTRATQLLEIRGTLQTTIEELKNSIGSLSNARSEDRKKHQNALEHAKQENEQLMSELIQDEKHRLDALRIAADERNANAQSILEVTTLSLQFELEQSTELIHRLEASAWANAADFQKLRQKVLTLETEKLRAEDALQKVIASLRREILDREAETAKCQRDIKCAIRVIDVLQEEVKKEQRDCLAAANRANDLDDKIVLLYADIDSLKANVSTIQKEKNSVEQDLEAAQTKISETNAALEAQQGRRPSIAAQCQQLQADVTSLTDELLKVKERNTQLTKVNEQISNAHAQTVTEKIKTKADHDAEYAAHKKTMEKLEYTQTKAKELDDHKKDLNQMIATLAKERGRFQSESYTLRCRMKSAEREIDSERAASRKVGQDLINANTSIDVLKNDLHALHADVAQARKEVGEAECRAANILLEKKALAEELKDAKKKVDNAAKENVKLTAQVEQAGKDREELAARLETAELKQGKIWKQKQDAAKRLRDAEGEVERLRTEIDLRDEEDERRVEERRGRKRLRDGSEDGRGVKRQKVEGEARKDSGLVVVARSEMEREREGD